jgi:ACT domain-containing protein
MAKAKLLTRRLHKMKVQLTTLDLYASGLAQMLPVLLDSYNKAKANHLIEDQLNPIQERALKTLPFDLHEVIVSMRKLAN